MAQCGRRVDPVLLIPTRHLTPLALAVIASRSTALVCGEVTRIIKSTLLSEYIPSLAI